MVDDYPDAEILRRRLEECYYIFVSEDATVETKDAAVRSLRHICDFMQESGMNVRKEKELARRAGMRSYDIDARTGHRPPRRGDLA